MSYYESAEDTEITRKRAEMELWLHGYAANDPQWLEWANARVWPIPATDVLEWLGY